MITPYLLRNNLYTILFSSGPYVRLVNLITLYRIVSVPFLLYMLFNQQFAVFKWMLLLSFSTDAIDGYLARKLNAGTPFGAMLDSIGDILTIIVSVTGFLLIFPGFIAEQQAIIISVC